MKNLENIIKIVLAGLFFLCLFDMPYGFYQLVRFLALLGFSILAYMSFERGDKILMIVYIGLAVLFQPLIKIALGRTIWNIVDVIVGVGLIVTVVLKKKN